ncbi:MAG: cyclic nucleotide-binding domain-containing protein [Proteobacteria bacterium]|nr:cyclic nucleotide-binding domain-containing protein [Pseudomonadota bacterium]
MKARATENHSHSSVNAIGSVVNNVPSTRPRGLCNNAASTPNEGDLALDIAGGDEADLSSADSRSELESSLPVSLKCLSVVSRLDEELLVALLQDASVSKFRQRENILHPDEPDDRIHMVLDGVVTLHTYTENGRQIINDYLGRGFFFGESALTQSEGADFWANSKGGCAIASIAKERFVAVGMMHPMLLKVLADQLIERLRTADHKACDLAFLDVSGRVANALQLLAKGPCAITHPDGMQIRMTRQEIGLIVGCSREMVGRAIKALAEDGVIEVNGKNIVVRGTR